MITSITMPESPADPLLDINWENLTACIERDRSLIRGLISNDAESREQTGMSALAQADPTSLGEVDYTFQQLTALFANEQFAQLAQTWLRAYQRNQSHAYAASATGTMNE